MRTALFVLCLFGVVQALNNRPIIGILDQPSGDGLNYSGNKTYLAANYVKWIESSGGRVVPVWFNGTEDYLKNVFNSVNGILFTGGDLVLAENSSYVKTAQFLLDLAIKENDNGVYFPVWGTCQGFELLGVLVGGESALQLRSFDAENLTLPLVWAEDSENSIMMRNMPYSVFYNLQQLPLTINLHHDGIYPKTFISNKKMKNFFRLNAYNYDRVGTPFASVMEGKNYPVYGVQFHPERNAFEWNVHENIDHSRQAIRASQYFGDFFVDEARKNDHKFSSKKNEKDALIYNFAPFYSEDTGDMWPDEQTYVFQWKK